ncbi:photosynthetic complex putative assembly protein PuhB [Methylobacterium durans]|uniref:photosynthetic complex putative assembly protein PuhB n=1 Tax=Methylobacterium durans TaxID=2202825 RepID=UPI002AFF6F1A|nr:photosynthetic complex putative assembly protein PuhB [Methylobacterium durans]MEA1830684.1 photosynthetic complex putative assembly protein PuhB [Methylobacterium durans]
MSAPANAFDVPKGLPEPLPPGERILWQGRPTASGIALRALHLRLVALWFSAVALWQALPAASLADAAAVTAPTLAAFGVSLALVALLGWLSARTTTYTITNRRIVMRVGIALPVTLNLPFAAIADAGLHTFSDGTGDLPVRLKPGTRIAYLHLWPHARPWRVAEPQPMLRSVPEAHAVAHRLAQAIEAARMPEESAAPILAERPQGGTIPSRPPRLAVAG